MARNPTQQTMKSLKLKFLTGFPPPLLAGSGEIKGKKMLLSPSMLLAD